MSNNKTLKEDNIRALFSLTPEMILKLEKSEDFLLHRSKVRHLLHQLENTLQQMNEMLIKRNK